MSTKAVKKAFDNAVKLCTGVVGDDCKEDLVTLGTAAGMTEEELKADHPELYERGIDNVSVEDFNDPEDLSGVEVIEEENKEDE